LPYRKGCRVLTPFDDYPIHPSADPIASPATGDPYHYDRYFFNGYDRDGAFFLGGAMGHYPVLGVIDAAFAIQRDGVRHSIFVSGRMPFDRATQIGPFRLEVVEPLRVTRMVVEDNEHGLSCDLTFRARTAAIEEPRQRILSDTGVVVTDHTRLTQWGTWEGTITLDGERIEVDPARTPATKDRSWGMRPVGPRVASNWPVRIPQICWLWAPLHFDDVCTHLASHERATGERWLESALIVPLLDGPQASTYGPETVAALRHLKDLQHELRWEKGRREIESAALTFTEGGGPRQRIELEKLFTFRLNSIGYTHEKWSHGSIHGELAVERETVNVAEQDPEAISNIHIQTLCKARWDDGAGKVREGVGILEQLVLGPHEPTGLTGFTDGYSPR
jgi:hypothetical protein